MPAFEFLLSMSLVTIDFDTDSLGTFTGETPRKGSALDAAFAKARIGAESSADSLGVGSEGTIGPSNQIPLLTSDVEIVAFVDLKRGVRVAEHSVSHDIRAFTLMVEPRDEYHQRLVKCGFPSHGIIVRPADGADGPIFKGLHSLSDVDSAVRTCAVASANGKARIESDFRANHCPSRRPTIFDAGRRLAVRLASCCPECASPGWGVVSATKGVPCSLCREIVDVPAREILGCSVCAARSPAPKPLRTSVDPSRCPRCNP